MGSMLWKVAKFVREFYTAWDATLLDPLDSALWPIGQNKADEINALTGGLKASLEGIFERAFTLLKDSVIKLISQQYDCFGLLTSGVPAGFDEQTFFWSDMLHYRETYRFAAVLWQRACAVQDPTLRGRFQAYALGWMSHLATDVTGHPFVNQKTGGPFRLHWQRPSPGGKSHGRPRLQHRQRGPAHLSAGGQLCFALVGAWTNAGSSRVDDFAKQPNPSYPPGEAPARRSSHGMLFGTTTPTCRQSLPPCWLTP